MSRQLKFKNFSSFKNVSNSSFFKTQIKYFAADPQITDPQITIPVVWY